MTEYFQPMGANEMPRSGGIATMMRLPDLPSSEDLDACFTGVQFDLDTLNLTGARFGPRQICTTRSTRSPPSRERTTMSWARLQTDHAGRRPDDCAADSRA